MRLYNPVKTKHANVFEYVVRGMSGPIARLLAKTPVTPNQVSVFRCLFMVASFYFFYRGGTVNLLLASLGILLWELFDHVDGDLAVLTDRCTEMGVWLESITDGVFGTVSGFLGFFVTLGIYREMKNVYPWIVFALVSIGYLLFRTLLHVDTPLRANKTLKEEFQVKERTWIGTIIHVAYYWVELYLVAAAVLYYPIHRYLGLNSLFLVMIFFALMYNCFWVGIVCMQYVRFRSNSERSQE